MALTRITPPAIQPVTLSEAKAHAAIIGTDDDVLVTSMIEAATAAYDGPAGTLGRCLIAQSWRLTLDEFPARGAAIALPLPPVSAVSSVSFVDPAGATVTMSPSSYRVTGLGSMSAARVSPAIGASSWPVAARAPDAVEIVFVAGFGPTAADVPADIRRLILGTTATLYLQRESTVVSQLRPTSMPDFDEIVDRWRAPWFSP